MTTDWCSSLSDTSKCVLITLHTVLGRIALYRHFRLWEFLLLFLNSGALMKLLVTHSLVGNRQWPSVFYPIRSKFPHCYLRLSQIRPLLFELISHCSLLYNSRFKQVLLGRSCVKSTPVDPSPCPSPLYTVLALPSVYQRPSQLSLHVPPPGR